MTAVDVLLQRKGTQPSKVAKDWLLWVDERKLVLLAMMNDAGDELSQLIRFFDSESHDSARVSFCISSFTSTCDMLFIERGCSGLI